MPQSVGDKKYKRILLKLSGEALTGQENFGIDPKILDQMALEVGQLVGIGVQVGLVVGGGNLFRGAALQAAGLDRVTGDHMGMLATVINALALQDALEKVDVPTRVQSAISMRQLSEPYIRLRAIRHLEKGRVVIFAAGTGNPFFTTDTTAALRAVEIGAEVVMKATNVDGVFDADPTNNPDAVLLEEVDYMRVIAEDLKVMDSTAITMCKDHNLPITVFNISKPGNIVKAVRGERLGTLVH